jgi:hypothetical protein
MKIRNFYVNLCLFASEFVETSESANHKNLNVLMFFAFVFSYDLRVNVHSY